LVADSKNVQILLFGGQPQILQVKIDQNLAKFDLQWLKLTFKQQNLYIFEISDQFAIKKSTISIYRATSIFDLHMRIFNLQGLGAPSTGAEPLRADVHL
jgi:hypothetical protein